MQRNALDNFDGAGDFVVVRIDRRSRWQLNTLVVAGGAGGFDSATNHGTPSRGLAVNCRLFPDGALEGALEFFEPPGGSNALRR